MHWFEAVLCRNIYRNISVATQRQQLFYKGVCIFYFDISLYPRVRELHRSQFLQVQLYGIHI